MLKAFRVASPQAAPDGVEGCNLAYVEAWHSSDFKASGERTSSFTSKPLDDTDLADWAWQRGAFVQAPDNVSGKKVTGGLRVLFVQPKSESRVSIPPVLVSSNVIDALSLPDCTYASHRQPSGVFSCHTYPEGSSVDDCTRLSLVFRTPQKWECSIGGFALSHDYQTGITTALSIGYRQKPGRGRLSPPDDTKQFPPTFESFIEQIKDCENLWDHPLLLPCLFLISHTQRVRSYIMEDLSHQVVLVEQSIGVTKAGASQRRYYYSHRHPDHQDGEKLFVGQHLQRERAKKLTQTINNLSTWIIFAKRSPQWDIDCIKFILRLLDSSERLVNYRGIPAQTFRETLDYVQNYSEACLEVTHTSEARMQLQLNILYTSVAQDDGQTSARLAASAGKDSTSMKIIALITASYLPATFVATLFSMGMFEWQGSSSGGSGDISPGRAISPDFWIYWAVAIPLTIITISGWAIWWKIEKHRFARDVQQVTQDKPISAAFTGFGKDKSPAQLIGTLAHNE